MAQNIRFVEVKYNGIGDAVVVFDDSTEYYDFTTNQSSRRVVMDRRSLVSRIAALQQHAIDTSMEIYMLNRLDAFASVPGNVAPPTPEMQAILDRIAKDCQIA